MNEEALRYEVFDMKMRLRAIKTLANSMRSYERRGRDDEVARYAKGILETADGKPGWGYSENNSLKRWEYHKDEEDGGES